MQEKPFIFAKTLHLSTRKSFTDTQKSNLSLKDSNCHFPENYQLTIAGFGLPK